MLFFFNKAFWFFKSNDISAKVINGELIIKNSGDKYGNILCIKYNSIKSNYIDLKSSARIINGNCVIGFRDKKLKLFGEYNFNENCSIKNTFRNFFISIRVFPRSEAIISNISTYENNLSYETYYTADSNILLITPSYPSLSNKYFGGFVHSRVKAYSNSGTNCFVACIYDYNFISKYSYDGINVIKGNYSLLDDILMNNDFDIILVHFFDEGYGKILDRYDLSDKKLYFWVHGPETLFKDINHFITPYFHNVEPLSNEQMQLNKIKHFYLTKYNNMKNVHLVFVSEWIKKRSEELTGITFNNFSVIPNFIDTDTFKPVQKDPEKRKKIFMLRRFDNINKYAIDINVRAILFLSKFEEFQDMEFFIYGDGDFYDSLVEPIRSFPNVHLYRMFLDHSQIHEAHTKCGLALFATRYDAQGVSMCEAASSGLLTISNKHGAIMEFIPENMGLLCDIDDYKGMAEKILYFYYNPTDFINTSEKISNHIIETLSFDKTLKKEIDLFKCSAEYYDSVTETISDPPLLSVIVPSFNAEKTLGGTIASILRNNKYNNLVEVLIINDGSTDNTLYVAERLRKIYSFNNKSCITIVNKENGGHGSTINVGVKTARGKYLKIVDSDDTLVTSNFETLINKLMIETSDIIVCDYYNDDISERVLDKQELYKFMTPEYEYDIEDICGNIYGFPQYGPILATSTIKSEILKRYNLHLSEKTFYVDMEFNAHVIIAANTIKYYPISIYKYKLGSMHQSVSQDSFVKNYKQHEKIIFNLIEIIKTRELTPNRKYYIITKLLNPMIFSHKIILKDYKKNRLQLKEFISKLNTQKDSITFS